MAPRPKYLVITKAGDYQHYRTRRPPWVKLHRRILDDKKLSHLPPAVRWLFLGLVILTSEEENRALLYDELAQIEIKRRLNLSKLEVERGINVLQNKGFIQFVSASKAQAFCTALRAERRGTEEEKKTSYPSRVSGSSNGGEERTESADGDIAKETKLSFLAAMVSGEKDKAKVLELGQGLALFAVEKVYESATNVRMKNPNAYILSSLADEAKSARLRRGGR
jgi:hypothetical protein